MTNSLGVAVDRSIDYISRAGLDVPDDIWMSSLRRGIFKADGDLSGINSVYHDANTAALLAAFEGGSIASPKNSFKRATVEAFGSAFDAGWLFGGGELPPDEDALDWLNARVEAEFGFIEQLFQQVKELRKEPGFDPLAWVSARADGYANTLREVYNNASVRAMSDVMVTFDGDDGAESCDTCQMLKGQRHRISWFVTRNYVPPFGSGLDCAQGGHCQHGLKDDNGSWVTI